MKRKSVTHQLLTTRLLLTVIVAVVITASITWVASRNATNQDGKLAVAASFYPLQEFAQQVGGDKASVTNITPAGAEPHDYEPSAKALADARKAKVFIYNGGTLEPWTKSFLGDYKNVAVRASDRIELRRDEALGYDGQKEQNGAGLDPHFWLDPQLAQQIVRNIRDGLIKADPDNWVTYEANAERYIGQLAKLDRAFKDGLARCTYNTVITAHDAFGYLATRYSLNVASIAGLSPEMEPSAARLAELSKRVREEGIGYVFFESLVNPRLADTIAQETGAHALVLDPIEGLTDEDQKKRQRLCLFPRAKSR